MVICKYDGIYRCVKCSFFGSEEQICQMYADLLKKYTMRTTRITVEYLEKL